ncbi:hypothetical protein JCM10207_003147 [Rhodosporidiobolus poonsookiae]
MNKLKQVFSHDDNKSSTSNDETSTRSSTDATTPSHSSAGDRSTAATDSSLTDKAAAATSPSTTETDTHGSKIAAGVEHLKEHAHPPEHRHTQPKQDGILSEADAKAAEHNHQHLAPVTHETHHHHEIEEVERQREVDRHVHHIQHHTQPVLDTQHAAEVHHEKAVPITEIKENHVATDEDKAQFAALNTAKDTLVEAPREKVIVDKGEKVHENVTHHISHLVQPVVERDTHEHHRIHTVIPVHQTVHEAPIVHSSVQHEPMSLKDFTAGGGDLSSKLKHDADSLLRTHNAECEREVNGPAETLVQQMGLTSLNDKSSTSSAAPTSNAATAGRTETTAAAGTTSGTL